MMGEKRAGAVAAQGGGRSDLHVQLHSQGWGDPAGCAESEATWLERTGGGERRGQKWARSLEREEHLVQGWLWCGRNESPKDEVGRGAPRLKAAEGEGEGALRPRDTELGVRRDIK